MVSYKWYVRCRLQIIFRKQKKTSIEPQNERGIKESENFYNNCLAECDNAECEKEKEKEKQISEFKDKIEEIEDAMESCRSVLMEKDTVIAKLQSNWIQSHAMNKPEMKFESFSHILNGDQIKNLKTISANERGDSTFVCRQFELSQKKNSMWKKLQWTKA